MLYAGRLTGVTIQVRQHHLSLIAEVVEEPVSCAISCRDESVVVSDDRERHLDVVLVVHLLLL